MVGALAAFTGLTMYEAHFGLRSKPFSILPDPGCLFLGHSHGAAMALLEHATDGRPGFVVLTGAIGTGKTTLVHAVMMRQPSSVCPAIVPNPHPHFGPLLGRTLQAFGIETQGASPLQMIDQFELFIEQLGEEGRTALLVVDEAHLLGADLLEELRMISNVMVNGCMPKVVLSGQPRLKATLQARELEDFAQRIVADCELVPLACEETRQYIEFRLARVGGERAIFTPAAAATVYDYTAGIPRLVNIVCDDALTVAAVSRCCEVDAGIVSEVARDRIDSGLLPLAAVRRQGDGPADEGACQTAGGGPAGGR